LIVGDAFEFFREPAHEQATHVDIALAQAEQCLLQQGDLVVFDA